MSSSKKKTYPLTRLVAAATGGYAIYCLAKPEHLSQALGEKGKAAEATDRVGYTYAARDLAISALAFVPKMAPVSAALRIAGDLGDAAVLGATGPEDNRSTLVGVPLTWGGITAAALLIDRARN